jgi:hypothetical protein
MLLSLHVLPMIPRRSLSSIHSFTTRLISTIAAVVLWYDNICSLSDEDSTTYGKCGLGLKEAVDDGPTNRLTGWRAALWLVKSNILIVPISFRYYYQPIVSI